jgi:Flp pilus assembly protein CpaB
MPEATRWLPLLAGLLLTTAAILMARSRIEAARLVVLGQSRPTEIVVASVPIHAGDVFSSGNLAKKAIPVSGTGKRNIPASEFDLLMHGKSRSEIDAGEPVLWTDVEDPMEPVRFSETITPGNMALTLEAGSTSSFAGLVRTNDRIDFLCKPSNQWIRGIPVLAVDRHYNRSGIRDAEDISTLTVLVSRADGDRLSSCNQEGTLSWFLKNPSDNNDAPRDVARRVQVKPVEIWRGGIQEKAMGLPGWSP